MEENTCRYVDLKNSVSFWHPLSRVSFHDTNQSMHAPIYQRRYNIPNREAHPVSFQRLLPDVRETKNR